MKTDHLELMWFVLEASQGEPLKRRVRILRGLARVCGEPAEEKRLLELAADLAETDELCAEFNLSFIQKNQG
jgi:hypothetical protein